MNRKWAFIFVLALIGISILIACGASGNKSAATTTVTLSDPATCAAPTGPFSNIYVTVTDVQVNVNPLAGDSDSGWQSAIPDMKGKPQQVDLLGAADSQCFLKRLGSTTQLQAGSYEQIRVILADDTNRPTPNACGETGPSNCIILRDDPDKIPHRLELSSEARTGIKIPSGQIAGGKFIVEAGQQKDLNLDFNACASIVTQGNGGYRLKPVLHAGEVTVVSSISGRVVDKQTGQPITGADVVVALEYNDGGTEIVKMQTNADANGNFNFCPVSPLDAGSYDVVAVAINTATDTAFGMTITTGVNPGAAMGNIPVIAAGTPVTLTGLVTAQTAAPAGTVADVTVAAQQKVTINSADVMFIVPLAKQHAVTVPLSTDSTQGCPTNTNCKDYSMIVPGANPSVGAFSLTNPSWSTPSGSTSYYVNAQATVPKSGGVADCAQPNQTTVAIPIAGTTASAPRIDFTSCQ